MGEVGRVKHRELPQRNPVQQGVRAFPSPLAGEGRVRGARQIRIGHSPDPDDAFMFYGISNAKIDSSPFVISHVIESIESLNQRALRCELEVTALSFHAYAYVHDRYKILPCGASFGNRYGPVVVARDSIPSLRRRKIAVPGKITTAFLLLRLYQEECEPIVVPFDQIPDFVKAGHADAGLLIHEGQITYAEWGLRKVVDLGEWWFKKTNLPIPLGLNAVRKDLPRQVQRRLSKILRRSIAYGLSHREEALRYAQRFARSLESTLTDRFVSMYVNERTLWYSKESKEAVRTLMDWAYHEGLIPRRVRPEYVEG